MERRINKTIEDYISEFKEDIKNKAKELNLEFDNNVEIKSNLSHLFQFIYDYERLILTKEDFVKRKRVKNVVHLSDRCCAKRANNDQCTRRRKNADTEFCGTHLKGTPHGICVIDEDDVKKAKKVEVWAQDIQGIIYYIDNSMNVYHMEDIMQSKVNPKIIAKYIKIGESYVIPEFNNEMNDEKIL
jgi:hypothetical protein